ncbi:MAG: hypothetical protein AAB964_02605, partial [Patescibacteria group bacterium]
MPHILPLVTPKFLTLAIAQQAIHATVLAVTSVPRIFRLDGENHHIVVLVPGMKDDRPSYPSWPDYQLHPVTLDEHSRCEKKKW